MYVLTVIPMTTLVKHVGAEATVVIARVGFDVADKIGFFPLSTDDWHTFAQCPFFWQLLHAASLAVHFERGCLFFPTEEAAV